jgi:sugar diacid utilization regulator
VDPQHRLLAGRFLAFVEDATGLPMIVCDETGTIVECRNAARLGTVHAFARRIVQREADELFVTAAQAAGDPRMKEGCNVAIDAEGVRLGTFGIAGPLELARPLARVAAAVFASWLKDQHQQTALTRAADSVFEGVRRVSARTSEVTAEAAQVVGVMSRASRDAADKVEQSGKITRTVQEIAQKSRILSLNGSMEASRAGAQGRAFSVVAKEMLELSESARAASSQIENTLSEVQAAIGVLQGAIERSAALANTQTAALAEVKTVVDGLQRVVKQLTEG